MQSYSLQLVSLLMETFTQAILKHESCDYIYWTQMHEQTLVAALV